MKTLTKKQIIDELKSQSDPNEKIEFVDAQEMAQLHPSTFEVPTMEELNKIKRGDAVKVCVNNKERFWILITSVKGDKINGRLDNEPVIIALNYNNKVQFEKKNVYQIM